MPKKKEKKGGDKQDDSKKTPRKENEATQRGVQTASEQREKDLYLIQIRCLTEQLERYQLKCDQLEQQKKDLISQYSALEKEKKDITEYLKRSLLEKEKEVDELSERLEGQRQAADKDRDALQLQHSELKQELQDRICELTEENKTLVERLASLDEFQKQKEKLMSDMESLEKQLANQKEEHKDDLHSLEMKALLEKKRLEKEMESHVVTMASTVQHLVDQRVPEATKLALQENVEMKARFGQLSEQTQSLMQENAALRGHKSRLSADVDILEKMVSETSRTSCVRMKVVEQLTVECQQLRAKQKDSRRQLEQLQTQYTGVQAEMETLRQDRASLSERCSDNRAEVGQLEAELQEERRRRSRMKSIIQEAAISLRQTLMEARTEQDTDMDSSVVHWDQLMPMLVVALDRLTTAISTADNGTPQPTSSI